MSDRAFEPTGTRATDPEGFVRLGLRALEAEFREIALLVLADWERLNLVAPELFAPIASLQRPSWGTWDGLIAGLANARKTVLRTGSAEARAKVESAAALAHLVAVFHNEAAPELVPAIR
jgi:hypothetical protein